MALLVHYFPFKLEFGMLVFVEGGNPEGLEENSLRKDENQWQPKPTCVGRFRNETLATVVEGKCSHHCAIPVPLRSISSLSSSLCILSISYKVLSVVLEETENWLGLLYKWWFVFNQLMLLSTLNCQISWDWAEHMKFGWSKIWQSPLVSQNKTE